MARRKRMTLTVGDLRKGDQIEVGMFRVTVTRVDRDVPPNWPKGSAALEYEHTNGNPSERAVMLTDTVTAFR